MARDALRISPLDRCISIEVSIYNPFILALPTSLTTGETCKPLHLIFTIRRQRNNLTVLRCVHMIGRAHSCHRSPACESFRPRLKYPGVEVDDLPWPKDISHWSDRDLDIFVGSGGRIRDRFGQKLCDDKSMVFAELPPRRPDHLPQIVQDRVRLKSVLKMLAMPVLHPCIAGFIKPKRRRPDSELLICAPAAGRG